MIRTNDHQDGALPIALRRTPRRTTTIASLGKTEGPWTSSTRRRQATASKTPCPSTQSLKRKRRESSPVTAKMSEYGSTEVQTMAQKVSSSHATTVPFPRKKRHSAPVVPSEIHIFPLRAILDDRVKRRIRRHGLSEEMHKIYSERKGRAQRTMEELDRLRDELAAKEAENSRLREESSLLHEDASRIRGLFERERHTGAHLSQYEEAWDMGAADGFTDHGSVMMMDDDDDHESGQFEDDTTIEGEESTGMAVQTKPLYMHAGPTLTPPSTSPVKAAATPEPMYKVFPPARACDVGVQACLEDAERDPDWQLQMDIMVQTLADKTAALADLNARLACLGAPGADRIQTVTALADAFQAARADLEELFPDLDPVLPSCQGIEVLNMVLQRLRDVVNELQVYKHDRKEHDVRESDLRQQLNEHKEELADLHHTVQDKHLELLRLQESMKVSQEDLVQAQETVAELRAETERLRAEADKDRKGARDTVAALRAQMLQTLQMSEAFLTSPVLRE